MNNFMEFIIDTTKPPIFPPNIVMQNSFFFGLKETKQSKDNTVRWRQYIKDYITKTVEKIPEI